MSKHRLVKIEIIGPPGSGKSTLAFELEKICKENNCTVTTTGALRDKCTLKASMTQSWERIVSNIGARVDTLLEVARIFPLILEPYRCGTHLQRSQFFRMMKAAYRHTFPQKLWTKSILDGEILIIEPGWKMMLLNGYLYSKGRAEERFISKFVSIVPTSWLTIGLYVEPETAIARLKKRSRGLPKRMKQLVSSSWVNVVERGNNTARLICRVMFSRGYEVFEATSTDEVKPQELAGIIYNEKLAVFASEKSGFKYH